MAEAIAGNVIGNNLGSQDVKPSTKKVTNLNLLRKPKPQQIEWKWSGTFYPNTLIKVRRNWGLTVKKFLENSGLMEKKTGYISIQLSKTLRINYGGLR